MSKIWGFWGFLISVVLLVGCRTPQPDVKPAKKPDEFRLPPQDGRYSSPQYPAEAFSKPEDPTKRFLDSDAKGGRNGIPSGGMGPR